MLLGCQKLEKLLYKILIDSFFWETILLYCLLFWFLLALVDFLFSMFWSLCIYLYGIFYAFFSFYIIFLFLSYDDFCHLVLHSWSLFPALQYMCYCYFSVSIFPIPYILYFSVFVVVLTCFRVEDIYDDQTYTCSKFPRSRMLHFKKIEGQQWRTFK